MKRQLLRSSAFVRAARRLLEKQPDLETAFYQALTLLAEDVFNPKLIKRQAARVLGMQRRL